MPKLKQIKLHTLILFVLNAVSDSAHSERMFCLCCDKSFLVELTVKKCWAVPADYAVEGIEYKGNKDLAIKGVITSRASYKSMSGVDYESYETDLDVEHIFVYEERNDKTCKDFLPGQTKLVEYEELGCVLINDKNFNDDTACFYGGHKVSDLPFDVVKALEKF